MSMQELEAKAAELNSMIDELKGQLRMVCRQIDKARAEKKIADMPVAEREALLAMARGA